MIIYNSGNYIELLFDLISIGSTSSIQNDIRGSVIITISSTDGSGPTACSMWSIRFTRVFVQ